MVNQQFATALHILTALGYHEGELMQSEDLARSIIANPVVVRSLVQKLARAKLVETVRGKSGGVKISRSPKKILLSEIYASLNPAPVIAKREKRGDSGCKVGRCMDGIVHSISQGLEDQVAVYLKKKTLAQVIAELS